MSGRDLDPEEAITKEEIHGEEPPPTKPQNAFTELMSKKARQTQAPIPGSVANSSRPHAFRDRMGLGAYLADPASFPPSTVIYYTNDFVVINDKFPKATIHTLLLPRSQKHNLLHPAKAFQDVDFLAKVKAEVAKLKGLVAKELERRLGAGSMSDAARQAVLNGDVEPESENGELPLGRDWEAEVMCGVHAVPSMNHLHVHVLSREMRSESLKHRKHYNSFNTPFFVGVDEFPLAEEDVRRNTKEKGYLKRDLTCWRCGLNFGNQFKRLKEHLEEEFQLWKRE